MSLQKYCFFSNYASTYVLFCFFSLSNHSQTIEEDDDNGGWNDEAQDEDKGLSCPSFDTRFLAVQYPFLTVVR
jgi:hypothetical protein